MIGLPSGRCPVQGSHVGPSSCSQHLRSGSCFLAFLSLIVHNMPQLCMRLFLVPYIVSLYSVAQGDVCPGASTAAEGPKAQHISILCTLFVCFDFKKSILCNKCIVNPFPQVT